VFVQELDEVDDVDRLRLQVRLLAAGLDMRAEAADAPVSEAVIALARDSEVVQAVRLLRRQTRIGLVAARRIVVAAAQEGP